MTKKIALITGKYMHVAVGVIVMAMSYFAVVKP